MPEGRTAAAGAPRGDAAAARRRASDIAFALALIALGLATVAVGLRIPPSRFDPLGSGAVPALIGSGLALLGLVVLLAAVTRLRIGDGDRLFTGLDEVEGAGRPKPWRAAGAFLLTVAYVGAMDFRLLGFAAATTFYVVALVALPGPRGPRALLLALAVALPFAFGLDYVFRELLSVDLP